MTTKGVAQFEAGVADHPLAAEDEDEISAMIPGASLQMTEHQANLLPLLVDEPGIARVMRFALN